MVSNTPYFKTNPSYHNPKKVAQKKQIPTRMIAGRRLWLFRIIALTIFPILLLLLAEFSLRIASYGFSPYAIIKCQVNGRNAYCDNVKFGWRFFPQNIARESEPFIFPAEKPDNTYRIFILGASAAQGTPEPAFNFGRILQKMLEDKYPEVNFEIINTAMTAINSHVVLQIAKDCARYDPDLFIVYLGNNEVTGPYGAGTVYTLPLASLPVIRIVIALKATRLGQLDQPGRFGWCSKKYSQRVAGLGNVSRQSGTGRYSSFRSGLPEFSKKPKRYQANCIKKPQ